MLNLSYGMSYPTPEPASKEFWTIENWVVPGVVRYKREVCYAGGRNSAAFKTTKGTPPYAT